jgi:hypothetical protein
MNFFLRILVANNVDSQETETLCFIIRYNDKLYGMSVLRQYATCMGNLRTISVIVPNTVQSYVSPALTNLSLHT